LRTQKTKILEGHLDKANTSFACMENVPSSLLLNISISLCINFLSIFQFCQAIFVFCQAIFVFCIACLLQLLPLLEHFPDMLPR